ncbi:hypothetical protein ACQJBY_043914 [Aegilops geniculata]
MISGLVMQGKPVALSRGAITRLVGSRRRGRHRAEHALKVEVSHVRYLIGWIAKKFDYINHIKNAFVYDLRGNFLATTTANTCDAYTELSNKFNEDSSRAWH